MVMVIHDALWTEAPHQGAEPVGHLMRSMKTKGGKLKVPLEVDIKWPDANCQECFHAIQTQELIGGKNLLL
jgi:hypothetical protein